MLKQPLKVHTPKSALASRFCFLSIWLDQHSLKQLDACAGIRPKEKDELTEGGFGTA